MKKILSPNPKPFMQELLLDDNSLQEKRPQLYPTLSARFVAFLTDAMLMIFIMMILSSVFTFLGIKWSYLVYFVLLIPLCKCWVEAKQGTTIGKRAYGIVVVKSVGYEPINLRQALLRNILLLLWFMVLIWSISRTELLLIIMTLIYVCTLIFIIISPTRRSFFDYLSKTVCINKEALEFLKID